MTPLILSRDDLRDMKSCLIDWLMSWLNDCNEVSCNEYVSIGVERGADEAYKVLNYAVRKYE